MGKFAPVCPIGIYEALKASGQLGHYHLLLAHDVLQHPDRYRAVFADTGSETVKILDNSVIELGNAVDIDTIVEAAKIVRANVIVLPDVLGNASATVLAVEKAHEEWTSRCAKELNYTHAFMTVPQGASLQDWVWCAEKLHSMNIFRNTWWSVPRRFRLDGLGLRGYAVKILQKITSDRYIHLLGFSDDILDDMLTSGMEGVRGIDSAYPLRLASRRLSFRMSSPDIGPRGDWWEKATFSDLMLRNIAQANTYTRQL